MNLYYNTARSSYQTTFNFNGLKKTEKTLQHIKDEILQNPNFCRDEKSITKNDLLGYLNDGIYFFTENEEGKITGLLHFEVNKPTITIHGLCVPGSSVGIGSSLIEKVKEFAVSNGFARIKLTCYDNSVVSFYKKKGFTLVSSATVYDSDEDSDDEGKPKYDMDFRISKGGIKSKKSRKSRKSKKSIKSRKTRKTRK